MRWIVAFLLTVALVAQTPDLSLKHSFEGGEAGKAPTGWSGNGRAVVDDTTAHGGKQSVRIERSNAEGFTTLTGAIPINFTGQMLEIRGWMKLEDVTAWAGFWIRVDGDAGPMAFDNMQSQEIRGTREWKQYSTRVMFPKEGQQLVYGVLLSGTGRIWADDLEILVDGKPVWEAPKLEPAVTIFSKDTEFLSGSKIPLPELTSAQAGNLVLLGKVWGFAKYHHPRVTAGELHWDFELMRVLPKVLAAADKAAAQAVLVEWLKSYGEVKPCAPCAGPLKTEELHLRPAIAWTLSESQLGGPLRDLLSAIHRNRTVKPAQFYVRRVPNIGNPQFENELAYAEVKVPDPAFQLLALYRYWNIIEYWFPYRDLIDGDWDGVLREFIPRLMRATSMPAYKREMIALIARVSDTHANLWSGLDAQPPTGSCMLPALFRFVENRAAVTHLIDKETGLQVGDVLESIDGATVAALVKQWSPYYPASNEAARLRDIGRKLGKGECVEANLVVQRAGKDVELTVKRAALAAEARKWRWHDRPGEAFQRLSRDVVYLKMSAIKSEEIAKYIDLLSGSKAVIIDSRSYPGGFTPFSLGGALVEERAPFARFTKVTEPWNPGAFYFGPSMMLDPKKESTTYRGKVVVLVDEVSQSSSEYQTMAWSAGPRAKVIGSQTAGADGDVSRIPLPFGQQTMISGIGVFYPDKRPTQRIGIVPAIEAKPTLQGIREGRDEVLERALRDILGPDVPEAEIIKMARPPAN